MEVVDAQSEVLCNREVLELLRNNVSKKHTNLATVLYETTSYLESSSISNASLLDLSEFLDTITERKYDLSKAEKRQIVNLLPQNEIELHLIVDNLEEKFTEEQRNDLLQLIQSTLNKPGETSDNTRKKFRQ